jgi:NlpC/P60 family putative phage cell wall peptidase
MSTANEVVDIAKSWLGTPYRHQASLKKVGCDCLGLVRGVWRECVGDEPEVAPAYSPDWAEADGLEVLADAASRHMQAVALNDVQAGDVVLFRWKQHLPAKHAGIATSATTMIHAQEGVGVVEISLSKWWLRRLVFAFRFPAES